MPPVDALENHRPALLGHCYRMLGSLVDADDAVQETMVRAWKGLDSLETDAALRSWIYRIATNVCLDALKSRSRRERPMSYAPEGDVDAPDLGERQREHWLEPVPEAAILPAQSGPEERVLLRENIRLAFVAALQFLTPLQRAALLLADVVGWSAAEIAEGLDTSVPAIHSALQRARATVADRRDTPIDTGLEIGSELLARYVSAFEAYDVDTLTALLHKEATLSMPPYSFWLRGPDTIRSWLLGLGSGCRGSRLIATRANGVPAFGQYRADPAGGPRKPWALIVLEGDDRAITSWNTFLDTETLFPRFDLPLELPL